MKLDSNNHSVFLLYYHLILVTKYRRKVIDTEVSVRLKEIFSYIAPKSKRSVGDGSMSHSTSSCMASHVKRNRLYLRVVL